MTEFRNWGAAVEDKPQQQCNAMKAVLPNVADVAKLHTPEGPNLASYLSALPEPLEVERNSSALRAVDFE